MIAVFDDLADFLSGEPEFAAATTAALLGTEPDVRHLRLIIGIEINPRIEDALGDPSVRTCRTRSRSPGRARCCKRAWGTPEYEQMGERLARGSAAGVHGRCRQTTARLGYDPYDYAVQDDPYPYYARCARHAPLYYNDEHGF